ncbi:hypothetical protein F511_42310 [Dorcoceras hygrometricum]|uniref:Uncharacterized protein n=1 Tax=Dorcoceras hygrometricum TaxID=472368 RepID=A0A2Z7B5B2_9LAMI|nr:hypothetical protein F511_42310 [Dorcoceras hygrometricum]
MSVTLLCLPTTATDVTDAFAQIRASIDQLHFEQIRRKDDFDKLRDTLLMHIRDIEKKFTERFDAHDRTYRVLLNNIHHDARDHKNLLSLDIKSSQQKLSTQKLSTQVAASAFDTVDVRKVVKELDAKVTLLDGQVAADLLNFHAKAEENHLNLSTQLGFLVDYINRGGDAKKGEGGSSRPQPPSDDQSRPAGEVVAVAIEQMNRAVLLEVVAEVEVREEETVVVPQKEGDKVILVFGNIPRVELKHSVDGLLFQRLKIYGYQVLVSGFYVSRESNSDVDQWLRNQTLVLILVGDSLQ